jgi:Family of unknown function (DUF6166)
MQATTQYTGKRTPDGCVVTVTRHNQPAQPLPPRLDLVNHSPAGFEWGYGGSGPAQLALAIVADCLNDDEQAVRLHQQFKWLVIAQLPHTAWTLTEADVLKAVQHISQTEESEEPEQQSNRPWHSRQRA